MSRNPAATYRLQLHAGFKFDEAATVAPYLAELGVSHAYCSPYLQAAPGSTHGYDVVDHTRVNEEMGGAPAHERFCEALGRANLGQVLDIVPNHMAIGTRLNRWWWDVLENGPSSLYASYFDVDWDSPEKYLRNLVTLPVLGGHYGRVLDKGELKIKREGGRFVVCYYDNAFPVSPRSLGRLLDSGAARSGSEELAFFADLFNELPAATHTDRKSAQRRNRDKEFLARYLERLFADESIAKGVDQAIDELNHDLEALDALLSRQNYRLAFWRTAGREVGYRRFFDINTLIGLNMEQEHVFQDTHRLVLDWVRQGVLDGLRVDHPDGLRDPQGYFKRLRAAAPDAWVVVEKIIEPGEKLPSSWPVHGTTGYDFAHRVGGLFVDPAGEPVMTREYGEFTGEQTDFHVVAKQKRLMVLRTSLASDANRLTQLFLDICELHPRHRDYTRHEIHEALQELVACFPVYRTYVQPENGQVAADDLQYVDEATSQAKESRPDLDADLFDFLRDVLLLRVKGRLESEFVSRFQQFTGPAMAKGVEDTTFYNYNRLVSLNEVGGNPGQFGVSLEEFHRACREAQEQWPESMLATSTHDTKRSEDVRARLALLSEMPERWAETARAWREHNERHRRNDLPDRNMEWFIYQTLVGAWPIEQERLQAYVEKAAREAKAHTSWTDQNQPYEEALKAFVAGIYEDQEFQRQLESFVRPLLQPGYTNALSQVLLKLTAPGVPDIYQGTELWSFTLVDPDNRRPVDYQVRQKLLREMDGLTVEQICGRMDEGLPKLWLIRQALRLRQQEPAAFGRQGSYEPIQVHGQKAGHVVAFQRGDAAITIAPRLVSGLRGDWGDTHIHLPAGTWRNVLTGEEAQAGHAKLSELLRRFPVALLAKKGSNQ